MSGEEVKCYHCLLYQERIKELEEIIRVSAIYSPKEEISESDEGVFDLSDRRIEELVEKYYTEELFFQGHSGLVSFIYSYVVRDDDDKTKILYRCIDQQKRIFQFQDEEGLHKDNRCKLLMDVLCGPLIKKVTKIYRILIDKIYDEDKCTTNSSDEGRDSDDSDSDNDSDNDIEEVIATELHCCDEKGKLDVSSTDDKVNNVVNKFLEIRKCRRNRKQIVDDLSQMLFI